MTGSSSSTALPTGTGAASQGASGDGGDSQDQEVAEQEEELGERREDVIDELLSVKKEIEGEPLPDEAVPKEIRGPRRRASVLLNRSRELSQTRMRVWAALDEAERRLDEIKTARRTLKSRGLAGLNALVQRREVSRSLRTFLEKIL